MPIDFQIDHERRLVAAQAHGVLTSAEIYAYQNNVWTRPDVAGYNELIDMTAVEHFDVPSGVELRHLAGVSAASDPATSKSKMAIVAPEPLAFGLGRMYEVYRGMEPLSTKQVGVFHTLAEAMAFLEIKGDQDAADAG